MSARFMACAVIAALLGSGCGSSEPAATGGERVTVVASFYPLAEVASRIGGDLVSVSNLTPAGSEPHELELTPRQVDRIEDADVMLYLGHDFQPAVAAVAERRSGTTLDVLAKVDARSGAADFLELDDHGDEHDRAEQDGAEHGDEEHADEESATVDPHFWLDPRRLVQATDAVEALLASAAPHGAETFAANAAAYKAELTSLDEEMASALATCQRREIVTSHAAFFYLADRYGLTQLPIAGLSPEAEPDPARLAELTDRVSAEGITTIFYEDLVSPAVAETLAREAHVGTAVLSPIEGLSKSDLDAGLGYADVMRRNLATLKTALSCTTPVP